VDDAQRAESLALLGREGVVAGVGAGELGLATAVGDRLGAEHRGLLRRLAVQRRATVHVPLERGLEVVGRRVLRLVERDPVDARDRVVTRLVVDLAEPAGERDLALRVEVQATEDQDAVPLQRLEHGTGDRVVRGQLFRADPVDGGADGGGERLQGDRRRHGTGSRQRSK
jgi:hypothetical protein